MITQLLLLIVGVIFYYFLTLILFSVVISVVSRLFRGREMYRYLDDQHKHEYYIGKMIEEGIATEEEIELHQKAIAARKAWNSAYPWEEWWIGGITLFILVPFVAFPLLIVLWYYGYLSL